MVIAGRISALFERYASVHMRMRQRGPTISDSQGEMIGAVDRIEIGGGVLTVAGWADADLVTLRFAAGEDSMTPKLDREDVAAATGRRRNLGFELRLPVSYRGLRQAGRPGLVVAAARDDDRTPPLALPLALSRGRLAAMALGLRLRFLRDGLRALPAALAWTVTGDPQHRDRIKRILDLVLSPPAADLDAGGLAAAREDAPAAETLTGAADPVTVIVPVYDAFDLLAEMIDRLDRHTEGPHRFVFIDDASPDPRVRPFLRQRVADLAADAPDRARLIGNDTNLGFIGSVNRALDAVLAEPGEGPVVLLNSDAMVPAGWDRRLVAPLLADPQVASATPLSNDAEILSVPLICRPGPLPGGAVDAIDAAAARAGRTAATAAVDLPTGVGFCMALSRAWLRRRPRLDPAFGRGYGEEVDWCQALRRDGGRHVAVADLFVEHRGGASFGSEEKAARIARNNALIERRYPGYDAEVQRFIAADPLCAPRLRLAMAWARQAADAAADPAGAGRPVPVYLGHSLGGGAEDDLARRIADHLAEGCPAVVLRVGGRRRWRLELHCDGRGVATGDSDNLDLVARLLEPLGSRRLIYSCGVGDSDPAGLPDALLALRSGPSDPVEVLFHDFFPLSPSYTLLDRDGVFRGLPGPDTSDPAHAGYRPGGTRVPLAEWRDAWHRLAAEAERLVVFSEDSAAHVAAAWPGLAARIAVEPHPLRTLPPAAAPLPAGAPARIAVLGNIGLQKGAAVLRALAPRLAAEGIGMLVIGRLDPAYPLPRSVPVIGPYRIADLARLAESHRISHWLIPSIWPETFSFTTREALATGRPVIAFDLGAQGDAVRRAANGIAVPLAPGDDPAAALLSEIRRQAASRAEAAPA